MLAKARNYSCLKQKFILQAKDYLQSQPVSKNIQRNLMMILKPSNISQRSKKCFDKHDKSDDIIRYIESIEKAKHIKWNKHWLLPKKQRTHILISSKQPKPERQPRYKTQRTQGKIRQTQSHRNTVTHQECADMIWKKISLQSNKRIVFELKKRLNQTKSVNRILEQVHQLQERQYKLITEKNQIESN